MTKLNYVKNARKDYPEAGIKAGEDYYWWKFRFGSIQRSKIKPPRSRLTQSAYFGAVYDLQDNFGLDNGLNPDDLQSEIEETVNSISEIRDECESSLDNMPESLRDSDSGTLLQERIEACDSAISELEGIDWSPAEELWEAVQATHDNEAEYDEAAHQSALSEYASAIDEINTTCSDALINLDI